MKSRFENAKKDNKGFSLVELIIAVVILGIIAVVAIGGLYGNVTKSRVNTDISNARDIQSALSTLSADKDFYTQAKKEDKDIINVSWTDSQPAISGTVNGKNVSDKIKTILTDGFPTAKSDGTFVLAIHGDGKGNVIVECRVYGSNHNLLEGEDSKQTEADYAKYKAVSATPVTPAPADGEGGES